ncbi:MAG TPA: PrsW family glutamic-type intramembrane protease [Blastocatellia bacterium]|nr:PrsW family glutamic-type intramembrane protease [Blastocatellia bacterium]
MIMLRLIIQSGSLTGRQFQFEPETSPLLLIGRGAESAVRLTEPSVSSRHALIAVEGDAFYLLDQNSANGTFLNETRVEKAELRHGDVIGLGRQGPRLQVLIERQDTMRIDAADTATLRHETANLRHETTNLRHETSLLDQDTSTLRNATSTGRYYAPPTRRLGLHDDARNLGFYNPNFDTGKSKQSSIPALIWLIFAVFGLMVTGLTILDVGVSAALAGTVGAIIPAGFYLTIFLWLDRYDPEPPGTLIFAFVWGAIIAIFFSAIVNGIASYTLGDQFTSIVSAPIVEESAKGVGVLIVALSFRKDFDSVVDGIVYAGVVALGFATVENIDYYGRSLNEHGVQGMFVTLFVRAILAPYSHVLFTCMTGIGVGIARETHNAALKIVAPIVGYISAMFLHALWNSLASFEGGGFFVGYFLFEVPIFCVFLGVVFHLVRREGRILKQSLAEEVERGLITQHQLDIAISVFRRTSWVAAAIGNSQLFNARRRFLRSVAKLGLCHWHKQRAAEAVRNTDSFPLIPQFQAEVFSLQTQIDKSEFY